jgi:hypothetical protein
MMRIRLYAAVLWAATLAAAVPAAAQVTTATVAGVVRDAQGGVIPGASVVLESETRGLRSSPVVTNADGSYLFINVDGDTYTVEVSMPGFRTLRQGGIAVSPGDRVTVPPLTIEVGATEETITVTAEAPLIQAQSGERSFTVPTTAVETLPISTRNFATLAALTPGTLGTERLGGGGQNNVMIDGVSSMDTGSNGQNLQLNIDAIAEVKILTSGYQAEYGRSSGLQITAVTRSGTNRFRGSAYMLRRDSDWNSNSWQNRENGVAKTEFSEGEYGYTFGGPVGKPGGSNKLFFFHSMEFRPRTTGGQLVRLRLPTEAERRGDFSQSLDNQGAPIRPLIDHVTGQPFPGNVIPQERIFGPGQALLNWWPMTPNVQQAPGTNYNTEYRVPTADSLEYQPAIRADYVPTSDLRISWRFTGHNQRAINPIQSGNVPGWNDTFQYHGRPWRLTWSASVNYTINPTTFLEVTYGLNQNTLGNPPATEYANRYLAGIGDLPLLFPDAGTVREGSYTYEALSRRSLPMFRDGRIEVAPLFSWGNLIGAAPPNLGFPDFLNLNRTQDVSVSLTRVQGRHTIKAGFYLNHALKAQNLTAGSGATRFEGELSFANDSNNPFDSGFGFANALLGVYTRYAQSSQFIEGRFLSKNIEWYVQDNWKVNSKLTLDYGLRFVHQEPVWDEYQQGSSFFVDRWSPDAAPALYQPACAGGVYPCSAANRVALNPVTGELLPAGSASVIGQAVPGTGDPLNGIVPTGVAPNNKYNLEWPALKVAPRFGIAYDPTGSQQVVFRGGVGLFFDRPRGGTAYAMAGNPPSSTSAVVNYGLLQNLAQGGSFASQPIASLIQYEFDNGDELPASVQWNGGIQTSLPFALGLDVSYVGQYSYNRTGAGGSLATGLNLNAVDFGTAYREEFRDPTRPASSVPGATALSESFLRPYLGYANIDVRVQEYYHSYHSLQASVNRRFRHGFAGGFNYTLTLAERSNEDLQIRLDHLPDGTPVRRADNETFQKLMENPGLRRHVLSANFTWAIPGVDRGSSIGRNILWAVTNDWQLSGVWTGGSGAAYTPTYQYQVDGANVNLTGSPHYAARIVVNGDPGSGCSGDRYRMFNTDVFAGPTYGSLGLESGRNYLRFCPVNIWDLAVTRNFRLGGDRTFQIRVDVFNAFNTVNYNGVQAQMQLVSPTNQQLRNAQFDANGNLDPARLRPQTAGFGAATSAAPLRSVQLQARFQF